jgi:hypothetical protein
MKKSFTPKPRCRNCSGEGMLMRWTGIGGVPQVTIASRVPVGVRAEATPCQDCAKAREKANAYPD